MVKRIRSNKKEEEESKPISKNRIIYLNSSAFPLQKHPLLFLQEKFLFFQDFFYIYKVAFLKPVKKLNPKITFSRKSLLS